MSKSLDIIVPVLNEEESVSELVKRIDKSLKHAQIKYNVIFVDDHSTDDTAKKISELSKTYPIRHVLKKYKPGKAYSILEGAQESQADYLVMIDGDLQYPPEVIPEMYNLAVTENLGVVTANRVKSTTGPIRKFVSKISRFLIGNVIMGIPCDIQSGLKLFRRDLTKHIEYSEVAPWALDAFLLSIAKQIGYKLGCVDIEFAERSNGKSKISIVTGTFQIVKWH